MIQRCCICKKIYGHKAPFLDTSETSGFCEECYPPFLEKIHKEMEEYRAKRMRNLERSK